MDYKRTGNSIIVRIDPGEEIIKALTTIVKKEDISLGFVTGIGAVNKLTLGLFRVTKKEYYSQELTGDYEIVALAGNITTMNGAPYFHLHMCASDENLNTYGGHLNEAHVSATAEIIIQVMEGKVDRSFSEKIGLNLLKL